MHVVGLFYVGLTRLSKYQKTDYPYPNSRQCLRLGARVLTPGFLLESR